MEEIWKDIYGYESKYKISNHGRVKSCSRVINCSHNKTRILKEKIMNLNIKWYGSNKDHPRLLVNLYYDTGKYKSKQVSRLVMEHFGVYDDNLLVLHNDNNTFNNRIDNLRLGTYSDNNQQAWDDDRQKKRPIINRDSLGRIK
jgi:hypothetical protein